MNDAESGSRDHRRAILFPHLSDNQWAYTTRECQARQLDLREVRVELQEQSNGGIVPLIIPSANTIRRLAGVHRGVETPPEFCGKEGIWKQGPWTAAEPPFASRVFVTRKDTGERFEGIAYWELCAHYYQTPAGLVLSKFWKIGGAHYLGDAASIRAHQIAFPQELANTIETTSPV